MFWKASLAAMVIAAGLWIAGCSSGPGGGGGGG